MRESTETVRFLGITDERDSCDCCGRRNLKRTVALDLDGEVVYFGTTCAAVALGLPAKEVAARAKTAQDEIDAAARAKASAEREAATQRWFAFLAARTGIPTTGRDAKVFEAIQSLGGMTAARALYRAAVSA